jgi:hypothetical protein
MLQAPAADKAFGRGRTFIFSFRQAFIKTCFSDANIGTVSFKDSEGRMDAVQTPSEDPFESGEQLHQQKSPSACMIPPNEGKRFYFCLSTLFNYFPKFRKNL